MGTEAKPTVLVTGATGKVGAALVGRLVAEACRMRAMTRSPSRAEGLPPQADVVIGDLDEPSSLPSAFQGVGKACLMGLGPRLP